MRRVAVLLVALLLTSTLSGCGKDLNKPGADQSSRLPTITLRGFDGQPDVDLGSFKGPAVVNLWASWCGPCKRELPLYAAFARTYSGKVAVLGVDFQETSDARAKALATRSRVAYPLVSDPDGELHAIGLPKIVLVDADGRIAYQEYVEIKSAGQLEALVEKHLGVSRP
ncbi:TlpA family protein disulfide reductase [Nocardioides marmorisolisilvae]|uniref:TlpA family protein disulfide reductase n=1 Tax=Nocardioides marmorisolisilvae TaxID=1542737 RepID=UPI001618A87F|nr:TlpA disulfide reductase family protein [Nocardioides marmorisolisilvae]